MENFVIRKTEHKGLGLFATREFKEREHILKRDLTGLIDFPLEEIPILVKENPELEKFLNHCDYVGRGKYVIDLSPPSYMNHSCDPNCYVKCRTIAVSDVYALKDINEGEELTFDVTATSTDQFGGKGFWKLECKCGSENCRGVVHGDFFKMPKTWQKKYFRNLPPSVKRKYEERFNKLRSLTSITNR